MSDYIEREKALKAVEDIVCDADDAERTCDRIIDIPAADVAPVRHGRWDSDMSGAWCSVCGEYSEGEWNYCPNCGAKMDGNDKWEE